jgi:hypothetical protein
MELAWAAYDCTRNEHATELDERRIITFVRAYRDAGGVVPEDFGESFVRLIRVTMRENLRLVLAIHGRGSSRAQRTWISQEIRCFRGLEASSLSRPIL